MRLEHCTGAHYHNLSRPVFPFARNMHAVRGGLEIGLLSDRAASCLVCGLARRVGHMRSPLDLVAA